MTFCSTWFSFKSIAAINMTHKRTPPVLLLVLSSFYGSFAALNSNQNKYVWFEKNEQHFIWLDFLSCYVQRCEWQVRGHLYYYKYFPPFTAHLQLWIQTKTNMYTAKTNEQHFVWLSWFCFEPHSAVNKARKRTPVLLLVLSFFFGSLGVMKNFNQNKHV